MTAPTSHPPSPQPPERLPQRIVLIGFSATGKSAVARALASRLGWTSIDTDDLIEATAGRTVPDIFAQAGEPAFRALERDAARTAAARDQAVVATGGGLWLDSANRRILSDGGLVVALDARWDTILARHAAAESARPDARPLLAGGDPIHTVQRLKAARQPFYALADATVHTDTAPVDAVVDQIVAAVQRLREETAPYTLASDARRRAMIAGPLANASPHEAPPDEAPPDEASVPGATSSDFGPHVAAVVRTRGGTYPLYCAWGLLDRLPAILDRVVGPGRVFLVADQAVQPLYGDSLVAALRDAGLPNTKRVVESITVPPGETSKNLDQLQRLYAWLADQHAERGDIVLALGGGVVTDLAGTAAATYLRGMPLVHLPTTLLGMVDASIGGKVAIDLPAGKNLVGAFYQPRAVVADVATLATLPPRELRAGFAEVIKHALISDPAMLDQLERDADALLALSDPDRSGRTQAQKIAVPLIARNMAFKARIVSADERESDLRTTLNYGHTIGHAIEAVTAYGSYLHGEAVAIGLIGAARIGRAHGLIDDDTVARHERVIQRFGLPRSAEPQAGLTTSAVLEAMRSDKKVAAGKQRWVLLESIGAPVVRDDVPAALVEEVVRGLLEPAPA